MCCSDSFARARDYLDAALEKHHGFSKCGRPLRSCIGPQGYRGAREGYGRRTDGEVALVTAEARRRTSSASPERLNWAHQKAFLTRSPRRRPTDGMLGRPIAPEAAITRPTHGTARPSGQPHRRVERGWTHTCLEIPAKCGKESGFIRQFDDDTRRKCHDASYTYQFKVQSSNAVCNWHL